MLFGNSCQVRLLEPVLAGVEVHQFLQERPERLLLRFAVLLVDLGGVRRVERDPQEDELSVHVATACQLLGAVQPGQRPVHAQAQIFGPGVPLDPLPFLESLVFHGAVLRLTPASASTARAPGRGRAHRR
jgi:hypothetical protein